MTKRGKRTYRNNSWENEGNENEGDENEEEKLMTERERRI